MQIYIKRISMSKEKILQIQIQNNLKKWAGTQIGGRDKTN